MKDMNLPSGTTYAVSDNEAEIYVQQVCKIVIVGHIQGMPRMGLGLLLICDSSYEDVGFPLSGRASLTQASHND